MTEPSLLAASISMKEDAYRRFIASKPANTFAEAAAGIILNGEDDFLALRYLKKDGALFAAYIFRWGDRADEIMEHPCFKALLGASDFMEGDERGRIVISPGALNFLSDGIEAAFVLTPGTSARANEVTKAQMARFDALLNKHIFEILESGIGPPNYPGLIGNPKIFPTKLRKKTEALLEKHRVRSAKERIPFATPLNPVRLFDGYYYNGHFLIYAEHTRFRPLTGLDPLSLRQRPLGAEDANHVVIAGHVITTDPKTFKVHYGAGKPFYTDASHVYGPDLTALPGSDPGSFAAVDAGFFKDRARWYAWDGTALTDVGATARTDKSLYYLPLCLLIGSNSIYMGSTRLALDASSFEIKRTKVFPPSRVLAWFSDKDGDAIVLSPNGMSGQIVFQRTDDPERLWEKLEHGGEEKDAFTEARDTLAKARSASLDNPQAQQNFVAAFESWLETNFERSQREHSYWGEINDYFYACWHLKDYQKIVDLYRKIRDDAWRMPYIFHHTACAFVATGNLDQAVWEVRNALIYGYDRIDDLLVDPDIAPLFDREDFQSLKTYREQTKDGPKMVLPPELLQRLNAIDLAQNSHILGKLLERFTIPNDQIISLTFADHPDSEKPYRDALATFINSVARIAWQDQHFSLVRKFYHATKDVLGLTPTTHLIVAIECFQDGFSWIDTTGNDTEPRQEFQQAAGALGRMLSCLENDGGQADPLWAEVSTNDIAAPFVAMARSGDTALVQFWRENSESKNQREMYR